MSVRVCGHHHHHDERKKLVRRILIGLGALLAIVVVIILLVWAILHPSKPRFVLQDVTIYNFTTSAGPPYALTTSIQLTISSRNPNDRVGVYYQRLDVFTAYRGQQITAALLLPASYQGHHDVTVWSPVLFGKDVPISPYLQQVLSQDLNVGAMLVYVKIVGRVKWKVGSWVSSKYHLDVNCPAYIRFGTSTGMVPVGPAMKLQLLQRCHVETALS